jgi:transposase
VRLSSLRALNALLYFAEHGCKWRGLPRHVGNWHSIYVRMNRWAKNGVLDRVFERLQLEQIVCIKIEAFSLDSTIVKVYPDGTGALKKRTPGHWHIPRRMDHQDSSGCRECSNGYNLGLVARQCARCTLRSAVVARSGTDARGTADDYVQSLRRGQNAADGARLGYDPHRSAQIHARRSLGIQP